MEPKPREVYAASRLSSRKNPNLLHSKLREQHYVLRLEPMILLIAIKNFGWVHVPSCLSSELAKRECLDLILVYSLSASRKRGRLHCFLEFWSFGPKEHLIKAVYAKASVA